MAFHLKNYWRYDGPFCNLIFIQKINTIYFLINYRNSEFVMITFIENLGLLSYWPQKDSFVHLTNSHLLSLSHRSDLSAFLYCFKQILHMKKTWYLCFWAWIISLSMRFYSSVHFPCKWHVIFLYSWIILHCVSTTFIINSSVDRPLRWFHELFIINSATINIVG